MIRVLLLDIVLQWCVRRLLRKSASNNEDIRTGSRMSLSRVRQQIEEKEYGRTRYEQAWRS